MIDSKLAISSTRDLLSKMKELEKNWKQFIIDNRTPANVRTEVLKSWKRCIDYNVDPLQKHSPVIMKEKELTELINQSNLYEVSLPIIEKLYEDIKGTGHLITLSDKGGKIIHLKGDSKIESQAQKMNFVLGSDWSEQAAGSNAIGTSLTSGQPIQILSFEHYCEGVHPWVCSACPIRDPLTQEIIGVIDLTGPSNFAQSHSLSVVQSISNIIEQDLLQNSQKTLQYLYNKYDQIKRRRSAVQVIVFDEMLNVVRGDAKCLPILQINHWKQLWDMEELKQLKTSLLYNMSEHEWEWEINSLNLKIFIQEITLNSERIGFVFCIEELYQFHPSDHNSHAALKGVIGNSDVMKQVISKAQVISRTNVPVLLTGESGTGKEIFAYAIHQNSLRKKEPFIAINCGAIPDDLITSELFGYESGAFTGGNPNGKIGKFEEANGGTILLDEIGEMPTELQVHLLRVLQEKEIVRLGSSKPIPIDVRIIAATNKNLKQLIDKGLFRTDLYFRLNVVELHLPPLMERKGDIPLLCRYFATELANTHGKQIPTFDPQVIDFFQKYRWPGNIRELMNVIEYAVLFCDNNRISLDSLPNSMLERNEMVIHHDKTDLTPLEQKEKEEIIHVIHETAGNLSETARRCKIARSTLYRKIKKYELEPFLNKGIVGK